MTMRLRILLAAAFTLLPAAASGQGRDCELVRASQARRIETTYSELWFVSGPAEFRCTDGTAVRADSAIYNEGVSLELIGRVFYADSARTLEAERAVYYLTSQRLHAQGSVVLTDRRDDGSVIRGESLTHERATPDRPEARTIVSGQPRPHATFRPRGSAEAAPGDTATLPFEVDADWMEIRGESRFTATGNVEISRGATRSGARGATFDQAEERLVLTADAWIEQEDLRLQAQTIEVALAGEQLRSVIAREEAHLEGRDLTVDATTIRLEFEDGALQRLIAVVPPPAPEAVGTEPPVARPRAIAHARDLRLIADSIDALAPGQTLREIIAVGDAFAAREPDSLSVGLPELIANDWVSGDTIDAHFALAEKAVSSSDPPRAGAEQTRPGSAVGAGRDTAEVVLERLIVTGSGGRAQALYRVSREGRDPGPPAINYTVADRITLVLSGGEVKEAEATGEVRGNYLEPQRRSARSAPGDGSAPGQRPPTTESR